MRRRSHANSGKCRWDSMYSRPAWARSTHRPAQEGRSTIDPGRHPALKGLWLALADGDHPGDDLVRMSPAWPKGGRPRSRHNGLILVRSASEPSMGVRPSHVSSTSCSDGRSTRASRSAKAASDMSPTACKRRRWPMIYAFHPLLVAETEGQFQGAHLPRLEP